MAPEKKKEKKLKLLGGEPKEEENKAKFGLPKMPEKFKKITFSKICFALLILFIVFGLLGWQNIKSAKRNFNATADLKGRGWSNQALKTEAAAAGSYGIAKAKVDRFYWQTEKGFEQAQNKGWNKYYLNAGNTVLQVRPEEKPKIIQGIAYTEIMLPKENGSFPSDKKIWVETSMFDWVDGGSILSNKLSIKKSTDGQLWKVTFYTDEVITITELKVGQRYIVTGAPKDELQAPRVDDSTKLIIKPQGVVLTNERANELNLKYKKGGQITIQLIPSA
jgi:hypothetical protein